MRILAALAKQESIHRKRFAMVYSKWSKRTFSAFWCVFMVNIFGVSANLYENIDWRAHKHQPSRWRGCFYQ